MSIFSLTCPDVGCYQNFRCDPEFQNKVVAIAYVKKSAALTSADKADADSWISALFEAYLNGDAYLVLNTSGEKPRPDTATVAGRGMQTTKALAKTHTINYQDMQGVVLNNVQFYNDLLASSQNYDLYYFTPSRVWDASGYYVTVIGDPVVGTDLNTYQTAEVTVTWTAKSNPLPYDFDTDTFLEGLFYTIGQGPTTDFVLTKPEGTSQTLTPFTATLSYTVPSEPDLVWSLVVDAVTEAATGVSIDSATGALTVNTVTAGTYTFTVQVTNGFGCVFGEQEITFVVTPA